VAKELTYADKYITALERKERVQALMVTRGFSTMNQLAEACGWKRTQLERSLNSDNIRLKSVTIVAHVLGCSMNFLSER